MARARRRYCGGLLRTVLQLLGSAVAVAALLGLLYSLQHTMLLQVSPVSIAREALPSQEITRSSKSDQGNVTLFFDTSTTRVGSNASGLAQTKSKSSLVLTTKPATTKPVMNLSKGNNSASRWARKGNGYRVAVVIPFRDREPHMIKFKEYWRWFSSLSPQVEFWDVYVAEQFDLEPFNRGWCFNVGFAVAMQQTKASPEIKLSSGRTIPRCVVIQDIDYLPEKGVDYASCEAPTQLSSEIDRYKWAVPYPESAGGIVAMTPMHWQKINGFSNDYFGWGGEDDELFHRLRLNRLLQGAKGKVIRRPPKGSGRFSGQFMHSMNHTKRITNRDAYQKNLKLLAQIKSGSDRWKRDGLSNLAFRILDHTKDENDLQDFGITYHHIRARRGSQPFELNRIPIAVPPTMACAQAQSQTPGGEAPWLIASLGVPIPQDLESLRARLREAAGCNGGTELEEPRSFLLVNLTSNLAKVFSDDDPLLLKVYFRSLEVPGKMGFIIASGQTRQELWQSHMSRGSLWAPPNIYIVCQIEKSGDRDAKYKLYADTTCSTHKNSKGQQWLPVPGAVFLAHTKPLEGRNLTELCYAGNSKQEAQRIVRGDRCVGSWKDLQWQNERHLFVRSAGEKGTLCVGTRSSGSSPASRILAKSNCKSDTDKFHHHLAFEPVDPVADQPVSLVRLLCISHRANRRACISTDLKECKCQAPSEPGRFAVWARAAFHGEVGYSVCRDVKAREDTICRDKDCCPQGWLQTFRFALPQQLASNAKPDGRSVCVGRARRTDTGGSAAFVKFVVRFAANCSDSEYEQVLQFALPSLEDVAKGLFTLLKEPSSCTRFICPSHIAGVPVRLPRGVGE